MKFFRELFRRKPALEKAFEACSTPAEICAVVRRWISACETGEKRRPDLDLVWRRGFGDCDDLARLVEYGCELVGLSCYVVWYYRMFSKNDTGHAIAYGYFLDAPLWYSSNGEYYQAGKYESLDQCAKKLLGYDRVWKKIFTDGNMKAEADR